MGAARRAARSGFRTSCSRCCCAPATPSATRPIPTTSCARSSSAAPQAGIDVFRIFDSLNSTDEHAARDRGGARPTPTSICEAAICYTGDILDPARTKYSLEYYVRLAKELVEMGTHILGIKDMAGLCKPYAAYALVKALRDEVGVPIHFHTHDTSGINAGSILRAADAGVDIADAALASMSGMTSQPCLNGIVAALRHTERDTGLDQDALDELSRYWAAVRELYYPFEEGLKAPGARRLSARDAGRAVHEPAAAGARASASRIAGRRSADAYADGQSAGRRHRQGHAVEQGRRRPRAVPGHQRPDGRRRAERDGRRSAFRAASSR